MGFLREWRPVLSKGDYVYVRQFDLIATRCCLDRICYSVHTRLLGFLKLWKVFINYFKLPSSLQKYQACRDRIQRFNVLVSGNLLPISFQDLSVQFKENYDDNLISLCYPVATRFPHSSYMRLLETAQKCSLMEYSISSNFTFSWETSRVEWEPKFETDCQAGFYSLSSWNIWRMYKSTFRISLCIPNLKSVPWRTHRFCQFYAAGGGGNGWGSFTKSVATWRWYSSRADLIVNNRLQHKTVNYLVFKRCAHAPVLDHMAKNSRFVSTS